MSKNRGQSASRAEVRQNKNTRLFSNKKGIQLNITRFGNTCFKTRTFLQRLGRVVIVHTDVQSSTVNFGTPRRR